jgi:anti-sigma regulatory factor (Ser/Thr protein kinase)
VTQPGAARPGQGDAAADLLPARAWLQLAAEPAAVGRARTFVREQCADSGVGTDTIETAVLLTSEIVTNALLHGRSGPRLAITSSPERLLVEVGDDNARLPHILEEDEDAVYGRGLSIVSMLATGWGAREDPRGKVVWFAL